MYKPAFNFKKLFLRKQRIRINSLVFIERGYLSGKKCPYGYLLLPIGTYFFY